MANIKMTYVNDESVICKNQPVPVTIGYTGPTGPTGPQGYTGNTGNQGYTGPQGLIGEEGPQGNSIVGVDGPTGDVGPTGNQGMQGAIGPEGPISPYDTNLISVKVYVHDTPINENNQFNITFPELTTKADIYICGGAGQSGYVDNGDGNYVLCPGGSGGVLCIKQLRVTSNNIISAVLTQENNYGNKVTMLYNDIAGFNICNVYGGQNGVILNSNMFPPINGTYEIGLNCEYYESYYLSGDVPTGITTFNQNLTFNGNSPLELQMLGYSYLSTSQIICTAGSETPTIITGSGGIIVYSYY